MGKVYTFPEEGTPEYKELMKSSFNIVLKMLFPDFSEIDFKKY